MRHLCSPRSFLWLLFLLGAGSLLLLLHLEDLTRKQPPGVTNQVFTKQENYLILPSIKSRATQKESAVRGPAMWGATAGSQTLVHDRDKKKNVQVADLHTQVKIQELRHSRLAIVCSEYQPGAMKQQVSEHHMANLFVEDLFRLLYCEVFHAGRSNWKRVLMVLSGKAASAINIPQEEVHANVNLRRLKENSAMGIKQRLKFYTKILFVREPFQRLVSGFRDEFENSNKPFHGEPEPHISRVRTLKTGATFREFVQCLLDPQCPEHDNPHWAPISQLCHPCLLQYHFIGKLENATNEGNFLLRHIGAPANVSYPDYKDRRPWGERTSSAIMEKYFYQLNAAERQGIYDLYRMDYLMFGYPKPLPDLH
ncbi:carbohydrate sulfotransferase 8-like [Cheilinus undulatus]|uniref:carbohydrate sulfotransferase 8-like n=1 Tax=Cheilinus undulatus TaxID=241271 RepID=UPI001BD2ECE0|nr:carbohydrate sulfotransferase 8-like [Cheilinus undulatus]